MSIPLPFRMTVAKAAVACLLLTPLSVFAQAAPKIGIVDVKTVFDNYYRTKLAGAQLQERITSDESLLREMIEEMEKAGQEFRKLSEGASDQAISADERERRKKSAEAKLLELQAIEKDVTQFRQQSVTRLEEQNKRMRERIIAEIKEEVTKQARAANFTLVIDSAAESRNHTPILLFFTTQHDLTEPVLAELNRSAPREDR